MTTTVKKRNNVTKKKNNIRMKTRKMRGGATNPNPSVANITKLLRKIATAPSNDNL